MVQTICWTLILQPKFTYIIQETVCHILVRFWNKTAFLTDKSDVPVSLNILKNVLVDIVGTFFYLQIPIITPEDVTEIK